LFREIARPMRFPSASGLSTLRVRKGPKCI